MGWVLRPTPNLPTSSRYEMDTRLAPVALVSWGCCWLVTGELRWLIPLLVVVVVAAWLFRSRPRALAACSAAVMCGLASSGWVLVLTRTPPAVWMEAGAHIDATVRLRSEPVILDAHRGGAQLVAVQLSTVHSADGTWSGNLPAEILVAGDTKLPPVGSAVEISGIGRAPRPATRSVGSIEVIGEITAVGQPNELHRLSNALRRGLVDAMSRSPTDQAGLVPSLVVGDTSGLGERIVEDFRLTGLTHVLAVSGSNFSLTLFFVGWLARGCGVRGWWLRIVAMIATVVFVITCRAEPSVLRAAVMGLIALTATGTGRVRGGSPRDLCVAVVILLFLDPWLSRSWGFALSAAATAGIVWWGSGWAESASERMPTWIRESVTVTLAAQLATQPLVTALSEQVSLVGVIANLFVGPFIGPATVLGLCAAVTSLVCPPLAGLIGWCAGWCVQPVLLASRLLADAPGASWRWPASAPALLLLAAGCLLLGQWGVPHILGRRRTTLVSVAIMLVGVAVPPPQYGWPGQWSMVACDVGQGSAQVFRVDDHSAVLVDTGPDSKALDRCLDSLAIDLVPLLVLSHPHADHIGGVEALATRRVGMVMVGDEKSRLIVERTLGLTPTPATPGQVVRVGELEWTTLASGPIPGTVGKDTEESAAENDAGIVGVVANCGVTTLVTGDIEISGQNRLLEERRPVDVDVYMVPHHGSAKQVIELVEAASPKVSIIQVGADNDYGHPTKRALETAGATGARVLRTDTDGAVAIACGLTGITTTK